MKIRSEEEIRRSLTHPQWLRLIGQLARRKEAATEQRKDVSDEEKARAMQLIIISGVGKGAFRGRRGRALKAVTKLEEHQLKEKEAHELGQKLVNIATKVGRTMLETPLEKLGKTRQDQVAVSHLIRNNATNLAGIGYYLIDNRDVRKLRSHPSIPKPR